jgi:uncharacterized protein YdbL (DUF1318 family)
MSSFDKGRWVGGLVGKAAAKTVHVTVLAAQGAGRFGEGVISGVEDSYLAEAKACAAKRAVLAEANKARVMAAAAKQAHPLTMAVG